MSVRVIVLAVAATALAAPAFADDCTAVMAAQALTAKTPHRLTSTQTSNGKGAKTSSLIQTADKIYLSINGKWRISPRTPAQSAAAAAEVAKETKYTCKAAGSEAVNGEATDVYQVHSVNDDIVADDKVWVSKAKKVTLKTETKSDETMISNVYDYANVQAPPGVN